MLSSYSCRLIDLAMQLDMAYDDDEQESILNKMSKLTTKFRAGALTLCGI